MRHTVLALAALAAGLAADLAPAASAQPAPATYAVVDRIKGLDGGWDYASFDPARRRLYIARTTGVMAVDVDSGKVTPSRLTGIFAKPYSLAIGPSCAVAITPPAATNTNIMYITQNKGERTICPVV